MAEGNDNKQQEQRDEIFSKAVRAGKRTYFFDVKTTRGNDLYLTITESKKKFSGEGKFFYEKHKLFLYKEDFEKFEDGFKECISKINELRENGSYVMEPKENHTPAEKVEEKTEEPVAQEAYTNVTFEDLGAGN